MNKNPSSKAALLNAIERGEIDAQDGAYLQEFIENRALRKNLSRGSMLKYYYALTQLLRQLHKIGGTVRAMTEEQAKALIFYVRNSQWSEDTREDYWQRFAWFYTWAAKRYGPWDACVLELMTGEEKYRYKKDQNKIERKGILAPEEVLRLVHIEPDLAYKAFFSVLYESGMRAGEAFSLLLEDVERVKGERAYLLRIRKSKTQKRPVPIEDFAVAYLEKWLQLHPHKDAPQAKLFVNTLGAPLQHATAGKHLRYLLRTAGIQKRKVTLHSFRHSRATEVAAFMNEFTMCQMFGWRIGSRMPATYIRDSGIDVRKAIRKGYGKDEKAESYAPEGRACLHCQHLNPVIAEYCDNCSLPLDRERLEKIKADVDIVRSQELLKKLLREVRADLIKEVKEEIMESQKKQTEGDR